MQAHTAAALISVTSGAASQGHHVEHRSLSLFCSCADAGCRPFLLQSRASYTAIGIFSVASYPYSFKLLWSPVVDSVYSLAFGRRKSWVVRRVPPLSGAQILSVNVAPDFRAIVYIDFDADCCGREVGPRLHSFPCFKRAPQSLSTLTCKRGCLLVATTPLSSKCQCWPVKRTW